MDKTLFSTNFEDLIYAEKAKCS